MFSDYKPKYTLKFNKRSLDEKAKSKLKEKESIFYDPMSYEGIIIDECFEEESGEHKAKVMNGPYIPFNGSMTFESTEISCKSTITIVNEDVSDRFEELSLKKDIDLDFKVEDGKEISGKLKKTHEDTSPYLSLFGTDKRIEDLSFTIGTGSNIKKEFALLEGGTNYGGYNVHFGEMEDTDYLKILIGINQERFDEISKLINLKKLDAFSINIFGTEGFYYDLNDNQWNPMKVKVLTSNLDNHEIPKEYKKENIPVLALTQSVFISTVTSQSFVDE